MAGAAMAEEIVIFDIDGTLADVSERVHHVRTRLRAVRARRFLIA